MISNPRSSLSKLFTLLQKGAAIGLVACLVAAPVASNAQETSGDVRGVVLDENGDAIANATVTIVNRSTGLTRTTSTNSDGEFSVRNLPIGYDYNVSAESSGFIGERAEGLAVNLGETANVEFMLTSSEALEEIVVVGTPSPLEQTAVGPSATFGLAELQSAPAINRNINDVIRADPRVFVDESQGDINAVQCAGKSPRYNSLTVDGVRLNDSFGLNDNGYPTERMPFSYDAISQVAVELAPFDVEYGGFSACNINAVTKSGGNEFSGSFFYDYTSDSLRGDKLEGDKIEGSSFDESRYGFTFGGPIIKDKLFFFTAYEKLDGVNLFERGPIGSGAVNEVDITQEELDEIVRIAQTVYLYDPGPIPSSLDNEDEKLLVKLDWNISDMQRLAFTYTYNDGFNWTESDSDLDEFEFQNHLYERGAKLNSYVSTLYSDWTNNFSTEIRAGYTKLDNRQNSFGGTDFGEMTIETDDVDVYIGGDDSRQANFLNYDVLNLAFKGNYYLGDHTLTFGIERESLDIFNVFVQHVETEIDFDNGDYGNSAIENFELGLPDSVLYNNAPSHDPNDAAADWGYDVNTVYLQDEVFLTNRLTLVAGVRYDWYTTSDRPAENERFINGDVDDGVEGYGFSNSATLDGEGLFQPRIGFTFDLSDDTVLRGGVGLYSGGNPNVWLSNNYSNNNVLQFGASGSPFGLQNGTLSLLDDSIVWRDVEANAPAGAGPGWGIPEQLYDQITGGTGRNNEINYLDPNFKIPSEWKLALGVTHIFPQDYVFTADLLISEGQDSPLILRGDIEQIDTTEDGYPLYESVREPAFVLTNSNKGNNSRLFSLGLAKSYENGFDFAAGYAWSDAEDVQPMNSAVAFSNYNQRAFFDPNEDVLATSDYNIEHRFTLTGTWRKELFRDSMLTLSFYATANSGYPYSFGVVNFDFLGDEDLYPFFLEHNSILEPGDKRNSETGSWWRKVDVRAAIDFPGFADGHRAQAYLVIDNLTNLLNDDWGILKRADFPRLATRGEPAELRIGDASLYAIRLGVQYEF